MISAAGGVEESIVLELDVAGRNLGNFCLKVKVSRHMSGVLFSMVV